MAETSFRGPLVNMGALEDGGAAFPTDGPSLTYQGQGVLDPRSSPFLKDGTVPGRAPAIFGTPLFVVTDQIPSVLSSTQIATAAQSSVATTALTLFTTSVGGVAAGVPSYATGVPLVPLGTTVAIAVNAIDFGFTTGTTVAGSSTVVVVDSTLFRRGHWYCIGGAGNTGNSTSLLTSVTVLVNATTINISPVAVGALSHAPIGNTNLQNNEYPPTTQFIPTPTATSVLPYQRGGLGLFFNPVEGVCRNITVTGSTTNATGTFLVTGYDIYGSLMTELLTGSGTTTVGGKKAFKYVQSVVTQAAGATGVYTVGIGDVFGINLRVDRYETLDAIWNGKNLSANAGFTAALATTSTNTTPDVRGTLSVQNFTAFNAATSNGTGRLYIACREPLMTMLNAAAGSTSASSLFGVAQSTT